MGPKKLIRALVALGLIVGTLPFLGGTAQARAKCMGHRATQVGDSFDDEMFGTAGRDVLVAGRGDDVLAGFEGNDLLCGGPGSDLIFGGPGRDRIDGMEGFDFASWNTTAAKTGVKIRIAKRQATGQGLDTWRGIEAFVGSRARDVFLGSRQDDAFLALGGNDRILGRSGDDLLLGGGGPDFLNGGKGADLASFYFSKKRVRANLARRSARGEGKDKLRLVEGLEGSDSTPSERADTLIGDGHKNFFYGLLGEDLILGGGQNDYIRGGGYSDDLAGQAGNDYVFGDEGDDDLGVSGNSKVRTEPGSDYLIGDNSDESTYYDSDALNGGPGKDLLFGGSEEDKLVGGKGEDVADYSIGPAVNVDLSLGVQQYGDTLSSIEDLFGSKYDDVLTGDGDANWIFGLGGWDQIDGGDGDDVLKGFFGNDQIFGSGGDDYLNGGVQTDELDGGLGVDTCKKGESTFMCELPLPGAWAPDLLPWTSVVKSRLGPAPLSTIRRLGRLIGRPADFVQSQ